MKLEFVKSLLVFSLVVFSAFALEAQLIPVAEFNFDDCTASDATGNYLAGEIKNNLDCECGVGMNSNSLFFSGTPDTLTLDPALKDIFESDFSLSFYFRPEPGASRRFPIISISGACDEYRDSSFVVRYLPLTEEMIISFQKNTLEGVEFRRTIDEEKCWQHVLFTREGISYSLYLNGEFLGQIDFVPELVLRDDYVFNIGYSECIGPLANDDQHMLGRIDEIKLFDRAITTEAEINELRDFPDQIISQDTTIFLGDSYATEVGFSCANAISWTPTTGVMDPNDRNPILMPTETTLYEVTFDHGNCQSSDQIEVFVISSDDVDCERVLLPTAFTPNSDGINDTYFISNAFVLESIDRFEIYDRWGLKIFETVNKDEAWDGRYNGTIMPPSTYVYKIEYTCKGESYRNTGSFNLMR